jgi:hypothetical protein
MEAAPPIDERKNEVLYWDEAKASSAMDYVRTGVLPDDAKRKPVGKWPLEPLVRQTYWPHCIVPSWELLTIAQSGISYNSTKHYATFSKAPFIKNQKRVSMLHIVSCLADPDWTGGCATRQEASLLMRSPGIDFSHRCLNNLCLNPEHIVLESSQKNQERANFCCSRLSPEEAAAVLPDLVGLTDDMRQAIVDAYASKVVCIHGPPRCLTTQDSLQRRTLLYIDYTEKCKVVNKNKNE